MIVILKIKIIDRASFVNCLFSCTAVDSLFESVSSWGPAQRNPHPFFGPRNIVS